MDKKDGADRINQNQDGWNEVGYDASDWEKAVILKEQILDSYAPEVVFRP